MNLAQLKEILSHAAELTRETDSYVIGSSAILVVFETPTDYFLSRSNEADVVALSGDPNVADNTSITKGELSPFHENHDIYADGCTFETPTFAPVGSSDRS